MKTITAGAAAGAAGTTALNIVTYLDMAVRGRPPSSVPEEAVAKFAASIGISLAPRADQPDEEAEKARNRLSGLGALSGLATGLAVGALFGLVRARLCELPAGAAALGAGFGAMAASDIPLTATGLTDPRTWGLAGWMSDVVPHLAYGFCTARVFDALTR